MKVPFLDLKLQHAPLRPEVLAALADTYDNTRFCLGKDVEDFEKGFSAQLGYSRTLGMNSGTSPLHVASIAGGFGPGDEIITTPFTFASSCWGISYVGATPVFVDIDADTWCISPERSRRRSRRRPKASSSCTSSVSRRAWTKSWPWRRNTSCSWSRTARKPSARNTKARRSVSLATAA